jgi:spectrin alpha
LYYRGKKLDESYTFQQFSANVEEEEAWITEKQHLLTGGDYGETMAAVQGLLKKHEVFETDFHIHIDRCTEIKNEGEKLISEVKFYFIIMEILQKRCPLSGNSIEKQCSL